MNAATSEATHSFQCLDAIRISLSIEREGLAFYKKAVKAVKNDSVKRLFDRLAKEEEEHIRELREKERFLQPAVHSKAAPVEPAIEAFIAREIRGKVFPQWEDTQRSNLSDLEAVAIGMASEERAIDFLERTLEREKKIDVRTIFAHLLAEERKHLAALRQLQDKVARQK